MFRDFLEDCGGYLFALFAVVGLVGVAIWATAASTRAVNERKAAACAHAMSVARTSADSVAVVLKCEAPEAESQAVPVIVPMYVPQ